MQATEEDGRIEGCRASQDVKSENINNDDGPADQGQTIRWREDGPAKEVFGGYGTVWYDMVWYGMVLYCTVRNGRQRAAEGLGNYGQVR